MKRIALAAVAITTAFIASPLAAQTAEASDARFKALFESWSAVNRTSEMPSQQQAHRHLQTPQTARPVRSHPSQGYDPCDSSHPDYGGADYAACMMKRGELTYDRQLWGIAKLSREARRQLREFGY